MACGTPVISTNCASGPREILADGRFGPLVPVDNSEAMAEAVLQVLDHPLPQEMLRQRGQEFTVERAVNLYIRLFDSVLHSARPKRMPLTLVTDRREAYSYDVSRSYGAEWAGGETSHKQRPHASARYSNLQRRRKR